MTNLTTEQLQEYTEVINTRLAEFNVEGEIEIFDKVSHGVARLAYDVAQELRRKWTEQLLMKLQEAAQAEPPATNGHAPPADYLARRARNIARTEMTAAAAASVQAAMPTEIPYDEPDEAETAARDIADMPGVERDDLERQYDNFCKEEAAAAEARFVEEDRLHREAVMELVGDLADAWPDMPDLTDGVDHFAEHPIVGEPPPKSDEKLTDVNLLKPRVVLNTEPVTTALKQLSDDLSAMHPPIIEPMPEPIRIPLAPATAATLGPEHTVETQLKQPSALSVADRAAKKKAQLEEIVAALKAMAVDGMMPSMNAWNTNKPPHLPLWQSISPTHNLQSWEHLAALAGLSRDKSKGGRPAVKQAFGGTPAVSPKEEPPKRAVSGSTLPRIEELIELAQRLSAGTKIMPSLMRFDDERPAHWLTAAQCVQGHNMTWTQLAEAAGLKVAGRIAAQAA